MGEQSKKIEGSGVHAPAVQQTDDEELRKALAGCDVVLFDSAKVEPDSYKLAPEQKEDDIIKWDGIGGVGAFFFGSANVKEGKKGIGDYLWLGAEALLFIIALPFSLMGCETTYLRCPEDCKAGPCYDAGSEIVCGCAPGTHEGNCGEPGSFETCCVADESDNDCHNGWC